MIEKYRDKKSDTIVEVMRVKNKPNIAQDILDFGDGLIRNVRWTGGELVISCKDRCETPFERVFPCAFGGYLVKDSNCVVTFPNGELEKYFYPVKEDNKKPPIGLMPRKLFIEGRIQDIKDAIQRYSESNKEIPTEWTEEYNDLIKQVNGK